MLPDRCPVLSCLSATLVYCGQTVGRIKMKLGVQVDLGPGHTVLGGDPAPFPQRVTPPIFGPYLLWPNGCMDQDATQHGTKSRPRRLCVRWGPRSPLPKKGAEPPPQKKKKFGPCLFWPNGWMDHDGTWHGDRPQPRRLCVRWRPSPFPKRGRSPSPIFGPFLLWPNGWMHQDATWYGGRRQPRGLCVRLGPSPPPKFSAHVYYSYCNFARTLHSRYRFVKIQVQVLIFYAS